MFVFVSIMMHPIAVYRSLSFILPFSLSLSISLCLLLFMFMCVCVLLSSHFVTVFAVVIPFKLHHVCSPIHKIVRFYFCFNFLIQQNHLPFVLVHAMDTTPIVKTMKSNGNDRSLFYLFFRCYYSKGLFG